MKSSHSPTLYQSKDFLPTEALGKIATDLITQTSHLYDNALPLELRTAIYALIGAKNNLLVNLKENESNRETFSYDSSLDMKKKRLRRIVDKGDAHHAKELSEHLTLLDRLKIDLDVVHDKVTEADGKATLNEAERLVKENHLQLDFQRNEKLLTIAKDEQNCFARLFKCCLPSKEIKDKESELLSLEEQVKRLPKPEDISNAAKTETAKLETTRTALQKQFHAEGIKQILRPNQAERDQFNRLRAITGLAKSDHYHLLTRDTMMQCMRFYELTLAIKTILNGLPAIQSAPATNAAETTALLVKRNDNISQLEQLFDSYEGLLKQALRKFYCHESELYPFAFVSSQLDFHKIFCALPADDKQSILDGKVAPALLDKFIPVTTGMASTIPTRTT